MKARTKLLLCFLLVAAAVALIWFVSFLRSGRFQELVRAALISEVEKATGMTCTVAGVQIDPFRGSFRLEGVSLRPRTAGAGPVNASADEVSGRVSVSSLWHLSAHLAELNIVHPQVALVSHDGGGNGWNPEEILQSLRISLDLAVGRVNLSRGLIGINNTRIPFELSLDELDCEVRYVGRPQHYEIRLAYRNSRFLYEGRDIKYDLDTRLSLSMGGIDIKAFGIRRGKTLLSGWGWVRDWQSPAVLLHATGSVDAEDLVLLTPDLQGSSGNINTATNVRVDAAGLRLDGRFDVPAAKFRNATMNSLTGRFEIRNDVLWLKDVDGKLGGGGIQAEAEIQLRESNRAPNRASISTQRVPLRQISWILKLPQIDFANPVDASAEATWKHLDKDLDLTAKVRLYTPSGVVAGRSSRLQGDVAFNYRDGFPHFSSANLGSPDTAVEISGPGGGTFHIRARTSMLSEPLSLLRGIVPSLDRLVSRQPDLMEISGTFGLDGEVTLEPRRTGYQGELTVQGGRWRSYHLDSLTARADWEDVRLELRNMKLREGAGSAEGDLTLRVPAEEQEPPGILFRGKLEGVSLSSLRDLGVKISPDVEGILSGNGSISNEGEGWSGEGQFAVEKASYKGQAFDSVRARITVRGESLQMEDGEVVRGAAKVTARGQIQPDTGRVNLSLRLSDLSLANVPGVQENKLDLQGRLSATGELSGDVENPSLKGSFEIAGLRYAAWDLGGGKGTLDLEERKLRTTVTVRSGLGQVDARATVSLEKGLPGKATLEFQDLNVQKILAGDIPAFLSGVSTALHGRIEAEGNFAEPTGLSASGDIDGARFKLHDYELHNSGVMRLTISNRRLRIEKVNLVGEGTSLFLNGLLPLDRSAGLDTALSGTLNLAFLQYVEKKIRVSGTAVLNVRATGSPGDPQVIGQASLNNARFEYGELPVRLSSMQGNIVFSRNLVRFENIRGAAGSGSIQLSGLFEHQGGQLQGVNLRVSAQQIRLPYPKEFRSLVNAELVLRGTRETQIVSGEISVVRAEYLKDINLLEQLASRSNASPGPLTTDPFLLGLRLDVDIRSDRGIIIDNELARLRASMLLTLKGTAAYPYLTGRVEASEGAILFRGNRFDIIHASADFLDRNRINPILDVRAEADVKTYRLVMDVNGALDHMNINVTSDPPLSTVDIVSLLTTGKSLEPGSESTRRQSEMAGLSAASILSESLTGVIGKRVQRIFGLQTFRVDPFLAGAENDPTARVTISERISKDLTLTFSRNLSTSEEQIVLMEYDVTRNLTIIASRDEQGKYGLDFRFRKRFR